MQILIKTGRSFLLTNITCHSNARCDKIPVTSNVFLSTEKLKMLRDADARKSQPISINWILYVFPIHCSCRMHTLYFHDFHDASADGMLFINFLVELRNLSSNVWCLKTSTIIHKKSMMEGNVKNIVPVSKLLERFMISVQTLFNFTFSDVVKLCDMYSLDLKCCSVFIHCMQRVYYT